MNFGLLINTVTCQSSVQYSPQKFSNGPSFCFSIVGAETAAERILVALIFISFLKMCLNRNKENKNEK